MRLRSVLRGTYALADEDAVGVSLRPLEYFPFLNAVWKAQHWPVEGGRSPFLLLQSAAFGRYLAVSNVRAELPSYGVRTVLDQLRPNPVTADNASGVLTYWRVETIQSSRVPLPLPPRPPLQVSSPSTSWLLGFTP